VDEAQNNLIVSTQFTTSTRSERVSVYFPLLLFASPLRHLFIHRYNML